MQTTLLVYRQHTEMETDAGGRSLFIISCEKSIDGKTSLVYEKKNTESQ